MLDARLWELGQRKASASSALGRACEDSRDTAGQLGDATYTDSHVSSGSFYPLCDAVCSSVPSANFVIFTKKKKKTHARRYLGSN